MVPLINKRDNFKVNFWSMRDLRKASECDLGSEKVIILTNRYGKQNVFTGEKCLRMLCKK